MPARHCWATVTVESADLVPALMPGDVLYFDPAAPLDLSQENLRMRVVVLTDDGAPHAGLLDGERISNPIRDSAAHVVAVWPVQFVEVRAQELQPAVPQEMHKINVAVPPAHLDESTLH